MGRSFGSAAIAAGLAIGFTGAPAGADGEPGLATPSVQVHAAPSGAKVSPRTSASDAAGGLVSGTITSTCQTSP